MFIRVCPCPISGHGRKVRLFQEGRILAGKASELLGLTRRGFVALLARRGIDYFRFGPQEWDEEVAAVQAWRPAGA